jgi:hypothetical protein
MMAVSRGVQRRLDDCRHCGSLSFCHELLQLPVYTVPSRTPRTVRRYCRDDRKKRRHVHMCCAAIHMQQFASVEHSV